VRNRRQFITLMGAAAACPLAARAQQRESMRRIGMLITLTADDPESQARLAAFAQGPQQSGWTVGQNARVDYRWSGGNTDDLRTWGNFILEPPGGRPICHQGSEEQMFGEK